MSKYDLIAIGDTTIDAFIALHEASVHCDLDKKNCVLCLSYADKVPYESLTVVPAVGNSSNVAVGSARLGLKSAILTAIGGDLHGGQVLSVYREEGVGRDLVKINHDDYDYFEPSRIGDAPWVYFSSMGEHALPFHHKLASHLRRHPRIRMGFNPGTFQLKLGAKKLAGIYRHTHVLFINREEAGRILGTKKDDVKFLFRGLHRLGPKIIAITDGPKGAYASDGTSIYFQPPYPDPKLPVERTGAGDAFSTGFMSALVHGSPVSEALRWGPVESMSVVQQIGAQKGLLTRPQLQKLLNRAPKNYHPRKI